LQTEINIAYSHSTPAVDAETLDNAVTQLEKEDEEENEEIERTVTSTTQSHNNMYSSDDRHNMWPFQQLKYYINSSIHPLVTMTHPAKISTKSVYHLVITFCRSALMSCAAHVNTIPLNTDILQPSI